MNYEEAVAFLRARIDYERFSGGVRPGTERIEALVDALDHPERTFESVHVTGTNGKFSVVTFTSRILSALGLTVGTYTSPNLESIRERIAVNGVPIGEERFAEVVGHLAPYVELVEGRIGAKMTYFDLLTATALEHFFDVPVHAAVLEVGLGGEYDDTNVVDARVAVITKVARDHLREFGDDPVRAAWEKAGIIKKGAVVVCGVDGPLVGVVEDRARERGADRLALLGRDLFMLHRAPAVGGQVVAVQGLEAVYSDLFIPVHGAHQADNLTLAIAACEALTGAELDRDVVEEALRGARLPARIDPVARRPLVVLDVGHNEDAAAAVLRTLAEEFVFSKLIAVVGMLDDKPVEDVLAVLVPVVDSFVVTAPDFERAARVERLATALRALGCGDDRVSVRQPVSRALEHAVAQAAADDLVLVFGSSYLAGEAMPWLRTRSA